MYLLLVGAALAQEAATVSARAFVARPLLGHPIANLRVGMDLTGEQGLGERPSVCAEVSPVRRLSLEGCGNGAGVLHQEPIPDLAHFRARFAALERSEGRLEGALVVGAGFAELQRADDAPGFRFGPAEPEQVEAAGPEMSAGVKGRLWTSEHTYAVGDLNAGIAHIPGAPTVWGAAGPTVTFGALTVGMGF